MTPASRGPFALALDTTPSRKPRVAADSRKRRPPAAASRPSRRSSAAGVIDRAAPAERR
eukprot:CAMPEP_0119271552 /NCGR_PEP_ID=MMETSP1329-20130426/8101_1 /TAXON_ID=114041 /ORGANISM="Genus nov. species nov., Strain RCC1024" /LENGTH=58 /DNA_ID=CAMNT_0007271601 /DNA_START=168 /DNA_END=341 /DNA_ORIENTATION=-